MSFLDNLSALLPFGKKEQASEFFFALNIGTEKLTAALWQLEGKQLRILETASQNYNSNEEIVSVSDKLLDQVLGIKEIEPQKILFGVPNSWLIDDNLKDEYLKLLRSFVKDLELTPMAYVAGSHALIHFLEKKEGIPITAILVGFEQSHITVTVARAGKLDGVKIVTRGETSGADIEKALLKFTDVETLPSKILIYGEDTETLEKLKSQLLSFSWMANLSFLHFPKIDILGANLEIESVCLAGGSEINSDIEFKEQTINKSQVKPIDIAEPKEAEEKPQPEADQPLADDDLGFVVGDVSNQVKEEEELIPVDPDLDRQLEIEDFEAEGEVAVAPPPPANKQTKFNIQRFIPSFTLGLPIIISVLVIILLLVSYVIFPKATVKIFVEPKVLENDTQVTADPKQDQVNEEAKIIPGQIVDTEISGSDKANATGKKQVGDAAKGTVIIYNKTSDSKTISKGTILTSSSGQKFTIDSSVNIASQSASDSGITFGKGTANATASSVGADGNIPSDSDLSVAGFSGSQVSAKSQGNFSGGTSKEITVVSSDDQNKLLAKLASDLRKQAQQKLQEKLSSKKILEEGLGEEIVKKSYSKNINDQASEFSLSLTVRYKGTAFEDKDLKQIVSKLVTTQVPEGFQLDLTQTETQADVSKLEKDGKLIFLARFKAKLLPKLDIDKIRNQIKFKTTQEVSDILKGIDNVLGSEIKITPNLPGPLQRLPLLGKNINIEVGLK